MRVPFFGRRGGAADIAALLEALAEPAAICELHGAVSLANSPWREAGGPPRGRAPSGSGLFAAFRDSRRDGRGRGAVRVRDGERTATVARLPDDRFLVRLESPPPAPHLVVPDPVVFNPVAPASVADPSPSPAPAVSGPARESGLEPRLAQRGKLEAIGQLAGGVAHDFNNLLTAIRLRTDELLLRHPLGDPAYESLSEIRETVTRAADVVRQLLAFSRKSTVRRETLDLGEALVSLEVLLRRLLREDVRLETAYGRDLPLVRADKAQLEAAVMNLVVNARDALRDSGGGTIRLRTARVAAAEATALGSPLPPAGDMALIEVADDGPGIPPELIGNIFDPFFTTKPVGEGTGLGLAMVYGIVEQSEGAIVVRSAPGEGAVFRIFLPVFTPPLTLEAPAPAKAPRVAPRDLSGAGRILFVEDEERVRGVAARLLRARGYEVLEAGDGEEALVIATANAGRIDIMISDVIMPGMDGPSLLKAARPFLGAAPVMFISGYAEAEFSDLLEGETGVCFLPKPLDIKTLAERVKLALDEARKDTGHA